MKILPRRCQDHPGPSVSRHRRHRRGDVRRQRPGDRRGQGREGDRGREVTWRGITGHQPQVQEGVSRSVGGDFLATSRHKSQDVVRAHHRQIQGGRRVCYAMCALQSLCRDRQECRKCQVLHQGPEQFSASSFSDKKKKGKCKTEVLIYAIIVIFLVMSR